MGLLFVMRYRFISRFGLLLTIIVLATALMTTGIFNYRSAKKNYYKITRSDAMVAIRDVMDDFAATLNADSIDVGKSEILGLLKSITKRHDVEFLGICDLEGKCVDASENKVDLSVRTHDFGRAPWEGIKIIDSSGRVRAELPLFPPQPHPGPMLDKPSGPFQDDPPWHPMGELGFPGAEPPHLGPKPPDKLPGPPPSIFQKRSPLREHHPDFHSLFVEYVSPSGATVIREAIVALAIEGVVVVLLLVLGIYFWRMSIKAEEVTAQLEADRQLKKLGQVSAVLGHELRNPIASLKGNAQLILEGTDPSDPMHSSLVTVVKEAKLLETLTNQILDFVRDRALQTRPTPIGALVEDILDSEDLGEVEVDVDPKDLMFNLDYKRVFQALVNLLRNARQASGEKRVFLRAFNGNGCLVIRVIDQGNGIPDDVLGRVFEPFFTTRVEGVGLGLALARRLIEAHGGKIMARNMEHGGAVFEIVIPSPTVDGEKNG
jgi:two-component system sensor histidine kinase HydH